VSIEVDATKAAGPDENAIGVICRYRDKQNFYTLNIGSDGYTWIDVTVFGETKLISEGPLVFSDAIAQGEATNHIRADCIADLLTLYVNDEEVVTATDGSFAEGDVGVLAGTFEVPGVEVTFDNFLATEAE